MVDEDNLVGQKYFVSYFSFLIKGGGSPAIKLKTRFSLSFLVIFSPRTKFTVLKKGLG